MVKKLFCQKLYQSRLPITISLNKIRPEIISVDDFNAFVRKYAKISIQTRRDKQQGLSPKRDDLLVWSNTL